MIIYLACPGQNFYIYVRISNNLAQLFIRNIFSDKLKVKVTLEDQTIKRSSASVNIIK